MLTLCFVSALCAAADIGHALPAAPDRSVPAAATDKTLFLEKASQLGQSLETDVALLGEMAGEHLRPQLVTLSREKPRYSARFDSMADDRVIGELRYTYDADSSAGYVPTVSIRFSGHACISSEDVSAVFGPPARTTKLTQPHVARGARRTEHIRGQTISTFSFFNPHCAGFMSVHLQK